MTDGGGGGRSAHVRPASAPHPPRRPAPRRRRRDRRRPARRSPELVRGFVAPGADSQRAVERIQAATGRDPGAGIVLLTSPGARDSAAARVARVPGVAEVARPGPRLVTGTLHARADDQEVARAALDAFAGRRDVVVGGPAVANAQITERVGADLGRAELIAFPFLLALSLLFFRGRAALMPVAVGVTTVLGTFLALSAINAAYALNVFALNLVMGLGLGLAIDYTLFLVTRFREELDGGADPREAVHATLRTAGRTVAFSAATVAAALITLILFPQAFLKSMGIAGATVAVVAAAAALVISPALFALWGRRPAHPSARAAGSRARWRALAHAGSAGRARSPRSPRPRCSRSPPRRSARRGHPSTVR